MKVGILIVTALPCLVAGGALSFYSNPVHTKSASAAPTVADVTNGVKYIGHHKDKVEIFEAIPFGQDTSGPNRFKPARPYIPTPNSTLFVQSAGPACPQELGAQGVPLYLSNITEISEDCLHLNVNRPNGTTKGDKLPVMVFIHGGSFWLGSKDELVSQPGGLILESIKNGAPVMHVSMNYRLGIFGFAQSRALEKEGSENAGLRDQRLAIEWVQNNIESFGGDPEKITIHGQSSGGLAVGIQILAYGASKPVPFQQAICQSQALETGITGNFTYHVMDLTVQAAGCSASSLDSDATVDCLRSLSMQQLQDAQASTYGDSPAQDLGDLWLPVVDGDFIPKAPSALIAQGKFAGVPTMIGWTEDDTTPFTPANITTEQDSYDFVHQYQPGMTNKSIVELLGLYPVSDFQTNQTANLSAQFYRCARILRDIIMTCQPIHFGDAIAAKNGGRVWYYDQNQTSLTPALESLGSLGLGVVHTSEFAYMFGNLSHYDVNGYPFNPSPSDYALRDRESRSWSSFAALGRPSIPGKHALKGWNSAYTHPNETDIFVAGGPHEGLWAEDGPRSTPAVAAQKLRARCGFLNSPEIIKQLDY